MTKLMKKTIIFILILFLIWLTFFKVIKVQNYILKNIYPINYSEYVYKYSEENGVDPLLTFAIIKAESDFDPNVTSHSNAIGLMQLMESTAIEVSDEVDENIAVKERLYNPEINIKIGVKYFAMLLERYNGNIPIALAAYNAGLGNVSRWIDENKIRSDGTDIENIPFKETNYYVRKILRDYEIYKDLYEV